MGWEWHGSHRYYYTKERIGRRVVSSYEGNGPGAELSALIQRRTSAQRRSALDSMRAARGLVEQHDPLLSDIARQCTQLARCLLLANGYHQHKGQWRKRRTMKDKAGSSGLPALPAADDLSSAALGVVMQRCNRSNATADDIKAMQRMVKHWPHLTELGDMLQRAMVELARGGADETVLGRMVKDAHMDRRKTELGYEHASAVERPLLLHVVLCEQHLGETTTRYAIAMRTGTISYKDAAYWEGRVNQAQLRYLRAVETLARIRRVRIEAISSDGQQLRGVALERPG